MKQRSPHEIIMERILPEFLNEFINKGADYGDSWRLLGAKGQFSDINRKFWKLYNSIWLDQELVGEQPDECAKDIIGHCFLLMYILRFDSTPEGAIFSSTEHDVGACVTSSDTVGLAEDRPSAEQVLEAVRRAARDETRDGNAISRIEDAILALYSRKELDVE